MEINQQYKKEEENEEKEATQTTINQEYGTQIQDFERQIINKKKNFNDEIDNIVKEINNEKNIDKLVRLKNELGNTRDEYAGKIETDIARILRVVFRKTKLKFERENAGINIERELGLIYNPRTSEREKGNRNDYIHNSQKSLKENNSVLDRKKEDIKMDIRVKVSQLVDISNDVDESDKMKKTREELAKLRSQKKEAEIEIKKSHEQNASNNNINNSNNANSAFKEIATFDNEDIERMIENFKLYPNFDVIPAIQRGGVKQRRFFSYAKTKVDRLIFYVYYYEGLVLSMVSLNKQIGKKIKNSKNSKKDFREYKKLYDNFHNYFTDLYDLLKIGKSVMIEKIHLRYEKIGDFHNKYENRIQVRSIKDVIKKIKKINIKKLKEDIKFTDV